MDSIARQAGLSKGAIYHHFRGKDDLLLSANQILTAPVETMMTEAETELSPVQGLRRFISQYIRFWQDRPNEMLFFFLSMTKVLADKRLWSMWEAYSEAYLAFFERLLVKGVAGGELQDHDARGRAMALMGALDGVIGYLYINRNLTVDWVESRFFDVFIDSLLPAAGCDHA